MEVIIHRINSIKQLKKLDIKYGAEIDIRSKGSDLILNHEPFKEGEKLIDYLDEYQHGTLILNIKEAGIEDEVFFLLKQREKINNYFLLDVEFPYIYRATKNNIKNIAIRFSEKESINTVKEFINYIDWVWIDTFSILPINKTNSNILKKFKTCLVCPERWGREKDILKYKNKIKSLGFQLDAVMTSLNCSKLWGK